MGTDGLEQKETWRREGNRVEQGPVLSGVTDIS